VTATVLLGRERQCRMLDWLLAAVREGESRTLVVRGDERTVLSDEVR
jgi:hypothetical protein